MTSLHTSNTTRVAADEQARSLESPSTQNASGFFGEVKHFLRQLGYELLKMFARKRTYIGFGAFMVMQILVLAAFQLPKAQEAAARPLERLGYEFSFYYQGLTLAVLIIVFTFVLLGVIYIALVAGDIVAKEVEEGTMRMLLSRPISRLRLLTIKWLACCIYTFALVIFLGITALTMATLYRGGLGGLFVFVPEERIFSVYGTWDGLVAYWQAMGFLGLVTLTFSSLAFMFSCFKMKPAAATILALSVFFVDFLLRNFPYFKDYEQYFMTYHTASWARTFQDPTPWSALIESLFILAALNLTFFIIGATHFSRRDLKT